MLGPLALIQYPHLDPVIFHLGPRRWGLAVRWYGVAYILGFLLGFLALRAMIRRHLLRISLKDLSDLVTWLVFAVILGGRLGWWLFYHRNPGHPEPWYEPIAMWHGGMSFHGALVAVILVLAIWSLIKHAPLWNIADCAALVTPIGLCFGRIANFINAELFGRPSTVPWAVIFPGESIARHPSQIYEALLEGPLLLGLLWATWWFLRPKEGRTAACFIIYYGLLRFLVEFTREPDPQLGFIAWGWLTMGQLLSLLLSVAGLIWFWALRFASPSGPEPPAANMIPPEEKHEL